jgi:hypothetical protein
VAPRSAAEVLPTAGSGERYNERLDQQLRDTGVVDATLFQAFSDVESDPNASSVGWLEAKLGVLADRVQGGATLSLHEPSAGTGVCVGSVGELIGWAKRHFPVARLAQLGSTDLFGKLECGPAFDYKAERSRKEQP